MERKISATLQALREVGFDLLYFSIFNLEKPLDDKQIEDEPSKNKQAFTETSLENEQKNKQIEKKALLEALYETITKEKRCVLYPSSSGYVFGEGNLESPVVFIGEAPGREEDQLKRPFVGQAGRLLNQALKEVGLKREEVYITNVVKSRPPNNRKPTKKEIQSCLPYLRKEIEIINPKLIVCLGSTALEALLGKTFVSELRGKLFDYPYNSKIKVLPTFHPAFILRKPDMVKEFIEDLRKVKEFLKTMV